MSAVFPMIAGGDRLPRMGQALPIHGRTGFTAGRGGQARPLALGPSRRPASLMTRGACTPGAAMALRHRRAAMSFKRRSTWIDGADGRRADAMVEAIFGGVECGTAGAGAARVARRSCADREAPPHSDRAQARLRSNFNSVIGAARGRCSIRAKWIRASAVGEQCPDCQTNVADSDATALVSPWMLGALWRLNAAWKK